MQFRTFFLTLAVLAVVTPAAGSTGYCASPAAALATSDGDWNGWGRDLANSRYQPAPELAAADVPKLKLKWAFGFPDQSMAVAQPTVVGGRVFVGSASGIVYALQASTGCIYWTYAAGAGVRTAVTIGKIPSGRWAAFFGDLHAWVHAVDAETGELLWKQKLDNHPAARITGSPVLADGRLYVPMSSTEETFANDPAYPCCSFRGSLTSLDAATGRRIWQSYTVTEPAKPYQASTSGTELRGPAGAAIWSSPTIDLARKLAYVATGNSYTSVTIGTSDAILAFDLVNGALVWSRQVQPGDNYIAGCPLHPSCPHPAGPDLDFGAAPVLDTLPGGRQVLLAGQKSGVVYALDPDQRGKILWQTRVGEGGAGGGIQWGLAADGATVYAPVSDRLLGKDGHPGLYALDAKTGAQHWASPAEFAGRNPAQPAASSAMPGVVFSGAVSGHFRAYAASDGAILWDFDTNRKFDTVNQVPAQGGSIDGSGPAIAYGMVFTNSGAEQFGGDEGNVLLAFSVSGI